MKISVITAVFNRKQTIGRAILSTKKQIFKNIEHIIIDGASTDGTLDIVNNLISTNDIFISEKDSGIYDALNKGIQIATGDIICFLHSDDFFESEYTLFRINELFNISQSDIIYGNVTFFQKSNPDIIVRKYVSPEFNTNNLSYGLMPAHPSMFIKKSIYEKHGLFNPKYRIAGDFDWLCRVSRDKNIRSFKINENLVRMQYGGASTSGIKSLLLVNKEVIYALKSNKIKSSYFKLTLKYFKKIFEIKPLRWKLQ